MLMWIIIIPVSLYLILAVFLYLNQRRLAFVPSRDLSVTPGDIGLSFEDIFIEVADGERVHGWYFPVEGSAVVAMLCHGNAGNISHRLETAEFLTSIGVNVLLFDYRGYGRSDGKPSEENAYADAEAAYRWLLSDKGFGSEQVIIFGRSLGGAVAVELATRVSCRALIVESSFSSVKDLGRRMFPYMPIGLLLRFEFDSAEKIASLDCPKVICHSPVDEIVPYDLGRKLYEAAAEPKTWIELSGGHNEREYFRDPAYLEAWNRLISMPQEVQKGSGDSSIGDPSR
jgi:fermentation-respiration switch protein FrsA (DUF1100 family)